MATHACIEVAEAGHASRLGIEVMDVLGQGCQFRWGKAGVTCGFAAIRHVDKTFVEGVAP
jgi:hypothetical protein